MIHYNGLGVGNNTKHAFLTRYTIAPGRMEVENCNSTSCRQPTVWHMISNKWNDPSFAPEKEEIPDLHSEFDLSEEIPHQLVAEMAPATPEKCQSKFSRLMVSLIRVIQNWGKSGQGDGGKDSEDEESDDEIVFGSLQNRSSGALDQRYSFVEYSQMYLLYWWHMLDKHDLLGSSLQRLDDSVAASNGGEGVLSVIHRTTETNDTRTVSGTLDDSLTTAGVIHHKAELDRLSATIQKMADMDAREQQRNRDAHRFDSLQNSLESLKQQKREWEENCFENRMKKNKAAVKFYSNQLWKMSDEIAAKETQLNDLLPPSVTMPQVTTPQPTTLHAATPQRDNRTPEPTGAIAAAGTYSPMRSPDGDSSDSADNEFE
jgi:hypothetical protein